MASRLLVHRSGAATVLVCGFLAAGAALAQAPGAGLFKLKGKVYGESDLSTAEQQELFDLKAEQHQRTRAFVENLILERYLAEQAKAQGKSRDEVEKSVLGATEPTDQEVSDWFAANKDRMPPQFTLEQVKGEIKAHLAQERKGQKREELLARLRESGEAVFLVEEPTAPVVQIDVAGRPVKGAKDAKVTLVEFADYQCPHCKMAGESIGKVLKRFDGKVRLVFLDFPINHSGISRVVAEGAVCADQQGQYWAYHDRAYAQQRTMTKESPLALAKELKLDEAKFKACLASEAPKAKVDKDKAEGERVGISGTPTIYVNGRKVLGYQEADLARAIERALKPGAS